MALDWQKANALIKRDLPVELKIGNDKRAVARIPGLCRIDPHS